MTADNLSHNTYRPAPVIHMINLRNSIGSAPPPLMESRISDMHLRAVQSRQAFSILLSIAACLLLLFSFSYHQESMFEVEGVIDSLLLTRVFPLFLAALLSVFAVPRHDLFKIFRVLLSVPFVFWCWYALVGSISGVASEIQPLWSAWKCGEIVIVMLWAAAVYTRAKRDSEFKVLKSCYCYVLIACYVLLLWTLILNVQENGFGSVINLEREVRLSNTWPNINPLSLAIISVYCLLAPHYLLRSRHKLLAYSLSVLPLFVLVGTRARTGMLALAFFAIFSLLSRQSSLLKKSAIVAIIIAFLFTVSYNQSVREVLRVSDYDEVMAAGGRFSSEVHDSSAWAKSLDLIAESPLFGLGYLNVKRFIPTYELPVDNFLLQALISAGIVGAIPLGLYVFFFVFKWSRALTRNDPISRLPPTLIGLANVALSLAFAKALTTNELSNLGFALILFFLVVISAKAAHHHARFKSQVQKVALEPAYDPSFQRAIVGRQDTRAKFWRGQKSFSHQSFFKWTSSHVMGSR